MDDNFFSSLQTESVNELSKNIDEISAEAGVGLMIEAENAVTLAMEKAKKSLAGAVEIVSERLKKGGRLIYAGAGTSGRLGVLDASECPPTFGVDDAMVIGIIAGGDKALREAVEGAEDSEELGKKQLLELDINKNDVVLAISASGYAPWCIGVLKQAKEKGTFPMSLVCVENSLLKKHSSLCIELITEAEVLTGSTRLKAGTATKRALNIISTLSMIRLGKVYKNLMVDVKTSNQKLYDRAIRIVSGATGLERNKAEDLLKRADMNAKLAIVMGLSNKAKPACESALVRAEGFVRRALELL